MSFSSTAFLLLAFCFCAATGRSTYGMCWFRKFGTILFEEDGRAVKAYAELYFEDKPVEKIDLHVYDIWIGKKKGCVKNIERWGNLGKVGSFAPDEKNNIMKIWEVKHLKRRLMNMFDLTIAMRFKNGRMQCCEIKTGPQYESDIDYFIEYYANYTAVASTTSNLTNSRVAMNIVDERNKVHVNTTVSKTSTVLATQKDVDYTYARCSFGNLGFFYYKGNGANLVRSSYFRSYFTEEETGIVNMELYGPHSNGHYGCRQHTNE